VFVDRQDSFLASDAFERREKMKQAIDKAGAAVRAGSERLEGKWLAFAADDLVDELVLSEDGGGTLKRFDREGRVYLFLDLLFEPRNDYFIAIPMEGELLELPYERSRDGRLTVQFPAHEKRVFTKSARIISEACMEGDLDSLIRLGRYYFRAGSEECVLFFTEAARRGSAEGKVYLGNYYYYQDKERAFGYYLEAAKQGHPQAELYVGLCYWSGEGGIERDRDKGFGWLCQSAEHGNEVAEAILDESWKEKEGQINEECRMPNED
jgi:hypothetical protein